MDNARMKNWLILLFFALDLTLGILLFWQMRERTAVSGEMIQTAERLLAEDGVAVADGLFPRKKISLPLREAEIGLAAVEKKAPLLFPDGYDNIIHVSGGEVTVIAGARILVVGPNAIEYWDDLETRPEMPDELGPPADAAAARAAERKLRDFLSAASPRDGGWTLTGLAFSDNDAFFAEFSQALAGTAVFNNFLQIYFDGQKVAYAAGNWFYTDITGKSAIHVMDGVSLILGLRQSWADKIISKPAVIEALKLGYLPVENARGTSVDFVPVWRVTADGQASFYKALNGDPIPTAAGTDAVGAAFAENGEAVIE